MRIVPSRLVLVLILTSRASPVHAQGVTGPVAFTMPGQFLAVDEKAAPTTWPGVNDRADPDKIRLVTAWIEAIVLALVVVAAERALVNAVHR